MKKFLIPSIFFLLLAGQSSGQIITKIASLGTLDFSVESSSTTANYTQTTSALNFSGAQFLGATLGGLWSPAGAKDWSPYQLSDFGLLASVNGVNPNMPFTLEVYDSNLQIANIFVGNTFGATLSPSFLSLTLSQEGTGNMNDIVGIQFTWDSNDSIDFAWEGIGVVPEPSTISLLVLGASALIFRLLRRRLG
jgi:hypothetical protein